MSSTYTLVYILIEAKILNKNNAIDTVMVVINCCKDQVFFQSGVLFISYINHYNIGIQCILVRTILWNKYL